MSASLVTEADVLKACLQLLALRRVPAVRVNSGAAKIGGRYVRFTSSPGVSDVLAVLPPHGTFLAVEVKAPSGRLRPAQAQFLDVIRRAGGISCVVRDVRELALLLDGLGV